jgi:hypothetical protein
MLKKVDYKKVAKNYLLIPYIHRLYFEIDFLMRPFFRNPGPFPLILGNLIVKASFCG